MDPLRTFFDSLSLGSVQSALSDKESAVWLAFAGKSDPAGPAISEADRAAFAQAISGFANSTGGVLLWGAVSGDSVAPIKRPADLEHSLRGLEAVMVERAVPGLDYKIVATDADEGFLAVYVPQSPRAPHRSVPDKEFYGRVDGVFAPLDLKAVEYLFARRTAPELRFSFTVAKGRATVGGVETGAAAPAKAGAAKSPAPAPGQESRPADTRPRIVAIDDNAHMLELLREGLEEDYDVHCAGRAQEGLRLIENLEPSVVILDIELPDLDGFAICETIRDTAWVRHIPVLFLTGHGGSAFESEARKAGGDAFLTKPFTIADLTATVDKLSGRSHKTQK